MHQCCMFERARALVRHSWQPTSRGAEKGPISEMCMCDLWPNASKLERACCVVGYVGILLFTVQFS